MRQLFGATSASNALENYFSLEKLALLARRIFGLGEKEFQEWAKPGKMMPWKKLKRQLDKTLPNDQVKIIGEKLHAGQNESVNWEDARKVLKELGNFDEADLDVLAYQIGLTKLVAAHLLAQVKQQHAWGKRRRKLLDKLVIVKQAADQLLTQARQQDRFARLEQEIRAINPEVLR